MPHFGCGAAARCLRASVVNVIDFFTPSRNHFSIEEKAIVLGCGQSEASGCWRDDLSRAEPREQLSIRCRTAPGKRRCTAPRVSFTYNALGQRVQSLWPAFSNPISFLFDPGGTWVGTNRVWNVGFLGGLSGRAPISLRWRRPSPVHARERADSTTMETNYSGGVSSDVLFYPWGDMGKPRTVGLPICRDHLDGRLLVGGFRRLEYVRVMRETIQPLT